MLSIARCREILGTECLLSDDEVKVLRDQLYAVAEIVLDEFHHRNLDGASDDPALDGTREVRE